jgi:predicted phage terminase large subunit-like protein
MRIGNDKAWAQEFLLRIVSDHERVVHPEWIHYGEAPQAIVVNKYRGTFIGIDPAISDNKRAACTAMVAIKVFGWGESMRIYVEPYPVNERIGFPTILERAKYLSDHYGKAKIYVEDVGFQRGVVQVLEQLRYPVQGIRPQGDKRARLAAISHHIKNGIIQFAPRGNEELVMQVVNFGSESFMDLVDALSMVVTEVVNTQQGYQPFPASNILPKPEFGENDPYEHIRPITSGLLDMTF